MCELLKKWNKEPSKIENYPLMWGFGLNIRWKIVALVIKKKKKFYTSWVESIELLEKITLLIWPRCVSSGPKHSFELSSPANLGHNF